MNNCATCDYKAMNGDADLHCYMFKDEPAHVCMKHTKRSTVISKFGSADMQAMILAAAITEQKEGGGK